MEVHFGEREINSLLSKVRRFNRQIGSYETYKVNDFSYYTVRLNNGSIYFIPVDFQLDSEGSFTPEILEEISERFQESGHDTSRLQLYRSYLRRSRIIAGIVFSLAFVLAFLLFFAWPDEEIGYHEEISGEYTFIPTVTESPAALASKMKSWEISRPLQFLSTKGNWDISAPGKLLLKGEIYSASAQTVFKNAKIRLTLLSDTGHHIAEDTFTVPGIIAPGQQISFEHVLEGFSGKVTKVLWEVAEIEIG